MKFVKKVLIYLRNKFLQESFRFMEKFFGVHILPVHFYSPVPIQET